MEKAENVTFGKFLPKIQINIALKVVKWDFRDF